MYDGQVKVLMTDCLFCSVKLYEQRKVGGEGEVKRIIQYPSKLKLFVLPAKIQLCR